MSKWYRMLLMGLVILIGFLAIRALDRFPLPKDDLLKERTAGFSGVLRLWICETNSPAASGLASWLIKESGYFEKKHDGVYIQVTPVSEQTLSSFSYASELPPDMIVFSPGMLESAQGLTQADLSSLLREEFQSYESNLCTPIAMGASFWAVRKAEGSSTLSEKTLLFDPEDASRALYALKSDLSEIVPPGGQYGIDLGLPASDEKNAAPITKETRAVTPGPDSRIVENARSCFIKGEGDALFLTQKSLPVLINSAGAPEFEIRMTGDLYADLVSLFAVTDTKSGEAREMCVMFLEHLLSSNAQKRLEISKAFSVTGENLYAGKAYYQEIEACLSSAKIVPAPAFLKEDENAQSALWAIIRGEKSEPDAPNKTIQP